MPDQLRASRRGVYGGCEQNDRYENTNPGESHAIILPSLNDRRRAWDGVRHIPIPAILRYPVEVLLFKEAAVTSFIAGCIAAILIAIIGAVVLDRFQEPATVAFSTSAVRL